MCFHHHLVWSIRIDNAHGSAVGVYEVIVDIRADVIQPQLLSRLLKAGGRGVVDVLLEKCD